MNGDVWEVDSWENDSWEDDSWGENVGGGGGGVLTDYGLTVIDKIDLNNTTIG